MKKRLFVLVLAVVLINTLILAKGTPEKEYLVVYAYDSFVSEWGPGQALIEAFKEKTGIEVQLVSAGNGGEILSKLALERHNRQADVVVGIANDLLHETLELDLFTPYRSPILEDIPQFLHFDSTYNLLPFDYGNFAFNYDSQKLANPPHSLEELLEPRFKKSLILIDPRTSSVGMGLLQWTIAVYGDNYLEWWEQVKPNVLTVTDGWSTAYGLFTEGEAPLVISYTTSPLYHLLHENSERYRSLIFEEGNLAVIEGVGIVKGTTKKEAAQQFIDFLLSEGQLEVALTNVMYPVNASIPLPDVFKLSEKPTLSLLLDEDLIAKNREIWLTQWREVMSR
ncbi:MAG: thiamine ABC transporter substrate-binding protein [Sphaerochaetaceae bacterium]|jgi:thiamine transport system substrate-binding protein|nr:thiamine ABC transporter substrate-binding protein [Spirochaetales bacterium]